MIVHYMEDNNCIFKEFKTYKEYELWKKRKKSKVKIIEISSKISHLKSTKVLKDFIEPYNNLRQDFIDINVYKHLDFIDRSKKTALLACVIEYLDGIVSGQAIKSYNSKYVKDFLKICLTEGMFNIYFLVDYIYDTNDYISLNKTFIRDNIKNYVINYSI